MGGMSQLTAVNVIISKPCGVYLCFWLQKLEKTAFNLLRRNILRSALYEKLEGTKTQANLMAAFAGESQAHTKYQYYASKAKKDGYNQIAAIFTETAMNEKSMQKFGLSFCTAVQFPARRLICRMPQTAKIMSGRICMPLSQKKQGKRDLTILLIF